MKVFTVLPSASGIASRGGDALKIQTPKMKAPLIIQKKDGVYNLYTNMEEFNVNPVPFTTCHSYAELEAMVG